MIPESAAVVFRFFVQQNLPGAIVEGNAELTMIKSPSIFGGYKITFPKLNDYGTIIAISKNIFGFQERAESIILNSLDISVKA